MKRILILLLTACMIAAAFVGCAEKFGSSSKDTNGNGLRDDVELKIMKAMYGKRKDFDPKDITITYYGTYCGVVIVQTSHNKLAGFTKGYTETVAGIEFYYGNTAAGLKAWYKNEIYKLTELYELGVLNEDDIKEIHTIYSNYKRK